LYDLSGYFWQLYDVFMFSDPARIEFPSCPHVASPSRDWFFLAKPGMIHNLHMTSRQLTLSLLEHLEQFQAVALLGARQVGNTTLTEIICARHLLRAVLPTPSFPLL